MNAKTFLALLARDAHVARRNFLPLLLQTLLQPMLLVFVLGRVLTSSGMMPLAYKSMLLPGIIALSMLLAGIQAVAMPLIAEFQFTKEIEDRLLAPIEIEWVAIEKVLSGMIQALLAGLVVLPAAWLMVGKGVALQLGHPIEFLAVTLLVALLSSAVGLSLGCSIGQTQIGLMFSLVLAPMIFFGCTYYPWSALASFPVLRRVVLANPIVYASEGLRASLVPQFPHLPTLAIFGALICFDLFFLLFGLNRFRRKAVS
ncbi:MAG TPA: ABC transporter permease [Thermoanaerobaculia bacterium]|nr:ABC transporter permease [Thermoanaerobaculia bacterium]